MICNLQNVVSRLDKYIIKLHVNDESKFRYAVANFAKAGEKEMVKN